MTASERFRRYLAGETVDRAPCIEWAPWWHLTLERWRGEGLPPEVSTVEAIQDFFGLEKCLQTHGSYRTAKTPAPPREGLGILEDEEDWARVKRTLFPPVETVVTEKTFRRLDLFSSSKRL